MRLVSYNILDGGEGRADPLAEVIEAARPDVVALIEADDDFVVDRIANRFKMDFVIGHGQRHRVALLSRWPIGESVNHPSLVDGFDSCLLEVTVEPPTGSAVPIGIVHLHPRAKESNEQTREREIETVLNAFARHRAKKTAHILCGDFNSNSPTQNIDLERAHPSTREEARANAQAHDTVVGVVPRRVVQRILKDGYVDTLHSYNANIADTVGSFTTQHPQQRVDYIFAHGPSVKINNAWIEQDRLAKYASDHFPIGVDVQL